MKNSVVFFLNGIPEVVEPEYSTLTLSEYLRRQKQLIGVKVVCREGDCGSCTVLVCGPGDFYFKSVNSCLVPMFSLHGFKVMTIEGLSSLEPERLDLLTQALAKGFATQCGYCTPGFVVEAFAILEKAIYTKKMTITADLLKEVLSGHLCRCTGYEPIFEVLYHTLNYFLNEPKFAQPLKNNKIESSFESILIKDNLTEIFVPQTLVEALEYKSKNPKSVIYNGGTDLVVRWNKGFPLPSHILCLYRIDELKSYKVTRVKENNFDYELHGVGANVSVTEFIDQIKSKKIKKYLTRFGSVPIKNSATLIGNLVNASPIADTIPLFMALNANLTIEKFDPRSARNISLVDFIKGYKMVDLQPNEIVTKIEFKNLINECELFLEKVSRRYYLDISIVNFVGLVELQQNWNSEPHQSGDDHNHHIKSVKIFVGGVGPKVLELSKTAQKLKHKNWDLDVFEKALPIVESELQSISDHRASKAYRNTIVKNLFLKWCKELRA